MQPPTGNVCHQGLSTNMMSIVDSDASHGVAYEVSDGQECAISDASSIDPHGPSAIDALKSGRY